MQTTHLATYKTITCTALIPLSLVLLASKAIRFSALSLDLEWWQYPLWFLPELCAAIGLSATALAALVATGAKKRLQDVVFMVCSVLCILLICLEIATLNFASVTGSLLDAAMVGYAVDNTRDAWDLVSSSTPIALKIIFAVIVVCSLGLPFFLRKKLTPLTRHMPGGVALIAAGFMLTLAPFGIAPLITPERYDNHAALPGMHYIFLSAFESDAEEGTARALSYSTQNAALVKTSKPMNVVLILLESTRASATTPYNPKLDTTPFLNELAQTSLLAERAYVVTPHTSKAITTTGCGVDPYLGVDIVEAQQSGIPHRCMANLFSRAGYNTAFFQAATQNFEKRPQLVKNLGFKEFYPLERLNKTGFETVNYFGVEDNVMLKPSMAWIKKQKDPFFLTYLTLTPHHDYKSPKRYGRKDFDKEDEFNRYLNSVNYVDHFVKNVIEGLEKEGVLDHTVVAVLGDHGEGFGEHDRFQHDKVIYEEGLTIPFIIKAPGMTSPTRITQPVSQLDLMPTLIDLSGHKLVNGTLPGLNLVKDEVPKDRALRAFCWSRNTCMAMIKGWTKQIHFFGRRPDEFYDLKQDPKELQSIPSRVNAQVIDDLMDWKASTNSTYRRYQEIYGKEFVFTDRPKPTHAIPATKFDRAISVYGYDLSTQETASGALEVTVTTYIEVHHDVEPGWAMFMHGFDSKNKMRNLDHAPVGEAVPVESFKKGTFIKDRYTFLLDKPAPGPYTIKTGFWHKKHGRMKARQNGERLPKNILPMAKFTVK